MLSWGSPATLWKSLASYRRHGLFDYADEFVVFFNEISYLDVLIARAFGVDFIGSSRNIGIGRAISALVGHVHSEHFLFLENDWELVEPNPIVRSRIGRALELLRSGTTHVVRLRHRVRHGEPLMTRPEAGEPCRAAFLLDSAHWLPDPSESFPGLVDKMNWDGEDWFFGTGRQANYTNNPCLYQTRFLREVVLPHTRGNGIAMERDINRWWLEQESIKICQSPGLFMHSRIDRGHPGPRWTGTILVALMRRFGLHRRNKDSVPVTVGGPWRSDL